MQVYYENGEKYISYTSAELEAMQERGETQSNWTRTMTEEELQAAIAADPDGFTPTDEEFARAYHPNRGEKPPTHGNVPM